MTTYFKAVRLDGTDFHSGTIQWADAPGGMVVHPDPIEGGTDAAHHLSVSTEPADCIAARWPCKLLVVEPVEGHCVWVPKRRLLPHKRAATAWRVVGERPAHEALGLMGPLVVELLDAIEWLTTQEAAEWSFIPTAVWSATVRAASNVAEDTARSAAARAARYAAGDVVECIIRNTARSFAWCTTKAAADGAARAVVVADLLTAAQFDALARPDLAPPAVSAVLERARAHAVGS